MDESFALEINRFVYGDPGHPSFQSLPAILGERIAYLQQRFLHDVFRMRLIFDHAIDQAKQIIAVCADQFANRFCISIAYALNQFMIMNGLSPLSYL